VSVDPSECSVDEISTTLKSQVDDLTAEVEFHRRQLKQLRELSSSRSGRATNELHGTLCSQVVDLLLAIDGIESKLSSMRRNLVDQQQLFRSLHKQSLTDVLTGLMNRRAFDEEFGRRVAQADRTDRPLSVLMIDIDHFKSLNDRYGHAAGDRVLRGVANLMVNALREMDTLARYGGEEFVVALPDTGVMRACHVGERIRRTVGTSSIQFGDHELGVTVSVGVATLDAYRPESLLIDADEALYAAKGAGRNQVFVHKDDHCEPLTPEFHSGERQQRRKWLRFLVQRFQVRLRWAQEWHTANALDESFGGIGVRLPSATGLKVGQVLEVEYCGEVRQARAVGIRLDNRGAGLRLGLEWTQQPSDPPEGDPGVSSLVEG
jgi:diguanylate cyclase (GGDEF)-like protein